MGYTFITALVLSPVGLPFYGQTHFAGPPFADAAFQPDTRFNSTFATHFTSTRGSFHPSPQRQPQPGRGPVGSSRPPEHNPSGVPVRRPPRAEPPPALCNRGSLQRRAGYAPAPPRGQAEGERPPSPRQRDPPAGRGAGGGKRSPPRRRGPAPSLRARLSPGLPSASGAGARRSPPGGEAGRGRAGWLRLGPAGGTTSAPLSRGGRRGATPGDCSPRGRRTGLRHPQGQGGRLLSAAPFLPERCGAVGADPLLSPSPHTHTPRRQQPAAGQTWQAASPPSLPRPRRAALGLRAPAVPRLHSPQSGAALGGAAEGHPGLLPSRGPPQAAGAAAKPGGGTRRRWGRESEKGGGGSAVALRARGCGGGGQAGARQAAHPQGAGQLPL